MKNSVQKRIKLKEGKALWFIARQIFQLLIPRSLTGMHSHSRMVRVSSILLMMNKRAICQVAFIQTSLRDRSDSMIPYLVRKRFSIMGINREYFAQVQPRERPTCIIPSKRRVQLSATATHKAIVITALLAAVGTTVKLSTQMNASSKIYTSLPLRMHTASRFVRPHTIRKINSKRLYAPMSFLHT